jgi:hypothetical protein
MLDDQYQSAPTDLPYRPSILDQGRLRHPARSTDIASCSRRTCDLDRQLLHPESPLMKELTAPAVADAGRSAAPAVAATAPTASDKRPMVAADLRIEYRVKLDSSSTWTSRVNQTRPGLNLTSWSGFTCTLSIPHTTPWAQYVYLNLPGFQSAGLRPASDRH